MVCIKNVLSHTTPFVKESHLQLKANLSVLVFLPFRGERLWGIIDKISHDGIVLKTPFCMITVPFSRLFDGCEFDAERGSVVWHYNDIDNYFVLK